MTLFALLTACSLVATAKRKNVCNLFIVLSKFFRKQPHKSKVLSCFVVVSLVRGSSL